jgi:hypothetical protein
VGSILGGPEKHDDSDSTGDFVGFRTTKRWMNMVNIYKKNPNKWTSDAGLRWSMLMFSMDVPPGSPGHSFCSCSAQLRLFCSRKLSSCILVFWGLNGFAGKTWEESKGLPSGYD